MKDWIALALVIAVPVVVLGGLAITLRATAPPTSVHFIRDSTGAITDIVRY